MKLIFVAALSYIIGSLPAAYLIGKIFFNQDIRTMGSGNVGTTNAIRNFGKFAGLATFLLDLLKGTFACFLGKKIGSESGMYIAMLFVVLGHMYSFILHFKAGKGVATTFGSLLFVDTKFAIILFIIFLVIFLITRIVSLSSIFMSIITSIMAIYKYGLTTFTFVILILDSIIIIKHRDNIKRLIKGEEKRLF